MQYSKDNSSSQENKITQIIHIRSDEIYLVTRGAKHDILHQMSKIYISAGRYYHYTTRRIMSHEKPASR